MEGSIIIYDKQDITCLGLDALLKSKYSSTDIFIVGNKNELLARLASHSDGIVIIDYTLSDLNSADGLLNIAARFRSTQWILFSDELSVQFLKRVVSGSDAFSVVLKTSDLSEIETSVSQAFVKKKYICIQLRNLMNATDSSSGTDKDMLTITEKEILKEIALGKTAKEIASGRNISIHTIITHRKNIYRKLDVNNAQEASRYALRAGIVDAADYFI